MQEIQKLGMKPTRFGFGEGLVTLGERYDNVVVLGGDITGSVMTSYFKDKFPERFFSIGIAEQNATTIAAGLALSGKIPFFASYGAFCALRNADQLRISVCYNEANVKIGGGHAGISVGPDGATHQVLEEVAFLRTLPHMTMIVPADFEEAKKATIAMGEKVGPAYIRFGRSPVPMFTTPESSFVLGKANQLTDGNDVAIITNGWMVWESIVAAQELAKRGIKARVINVHTVKPFDVETVVNSARECGCIVTAEEHQVYAGLGGAVAEVVGKNAPVPIEYVGVKDSFGGSGEPEELMQKFGLTWRQVYASALVAMERRDKGSTGYRKLTDIAEYQEEQSA
jgi:transketolase